MNSYSSADIIDAALAKNLVAEQFPQWAQLPIRPVPVSGWDHMTFHLGADMVLRFPGAAGYAPQIHKEQIWLPRLSPALSVSIPEPMGLGEPGYGYPYHWSISNWIPGETIACSPRINKRVLAEDLGVFLLDLQKIETAGAPVPGAHNCYRGGDLKVYDADVQKALAILGKTYECQAFRKIWLDAKKSKWKSPPVWTHGDISAGNLLVQNGRLCAVIDFGLLSAGDPACDFAIAWTFFDEKSRDHFRSVLEVDDDVWARGKAWALWKALIIQAKMTGSNAIEVEQSGKVLAALISD